MNGIRQAIKDNAAARDENTAAADRLGEAIRAADWNGHTPDDLPASDYDRGYQAGYNQALLNVCYQLAKSAHDELTATLAKLERPAA